MVDRGEASQTSSGTGPPGAHTTSSATCRTLRFSSCERRARCSTASSALVPWRPMRICLARSMPAREVIASRTWLTESVAWARPALGLEVGPPTSDGSRCGELGGEG